MKPDQKRQIINRRILKALHIGDLRIPIPIVQGGMGIGISLSGLASAVANMGGIGVISTVGVGFIEDTGSKNLRNRHIEAIREEIRKAREKTSGVLGVNIMTVITNFSDMVRTSIEEGIDVIFSGAGLPLDLPKYLSEGIKTKLVPIVSSGRAASLLCSKWKQNYNYLPDALVVEGPKAGGHLGFKPNDIDDANKSLEFLVDDVVKVSRDIKDKYDKDIPVIAAGGIYSGDDMYRIMERGATAVQLGTRFVATEECDASIDFKKTFISARESDIKIIKSPVGLPGRTIGNKFLDDAKAGLKRPASCKYNCIKTCDPKTTSYCIADALLAAYRGNMNDGFAFTGSNAWKVKGITSVKHVFEDLINEFKNSNILNRKS